MGSMGGMDMMPMDPAAEAAALCVASNPFDLAFINAMIPHHESAVAMAEVVLQKAVHPEVAELAHAIVDVQQAEIEQMEQWRADWFGASPAVTPEGLADVISVDVTLDEFSVGSTGTAFIVGQVYRFVVTNHGALPHEFMIVPSVDGIGGTEMEHLHDVALAVISESELTPGATQAIEVTFNEPGTFEIVCAIAGHYDSGMTLVVEISS